MTANELEGPFWGDGNVPKLNCDGCATICLLKIIKFTLNICEFYGM